MTAQTTYGPSHIRRVNVLYNATNGVDFNVHNASLCNTTRAILERVFFVKSGNGFARPPRPSVCINRELLPFRKCFAKYAFQTTPISLQQFVDCYEGRKKQMYQNAVDSLGTRPLMVSDSYISAFVKAEKVNFTAKSDPAPRIIQPRSPRYNASVGIYIKPIEHRIYKIVAKVFGSPTIAKGLNCEQVGRMVARKWAKFDRPVAIGLDASRFDQHCSPAILRWEHDIYKMFYPGDKRLRMLLGWQIRNRGYANTKDGRIKYTTDGCRMSGDMNTGLGNCLIMCALVWTYFGQDRKHMFELINNGDDCVVFCDYKDLSMLGGIGNFFLKMGYTLKIEEPVDVLERVEFCQTQPVTNGQSYRMVRNPAVCLTKDLISFKNLSDSSSWAYQCQAISDCGLAAYGDMPCLGAFYNSLNVGYDYKRDAHCETGFQYAARGLNYRFQEPTVEARVSFWRAFGIAPDDQTAIEEYYSGVHPGYDPGPVVKFKTATEITNTI